MVFSYDAECGADLSNHPRPMRKTISNGDNAVLETHGRAVVGQTNTFSAANSAFGSYWA
jgi:hypothetical protein